MALVVGGVTVTGTQTLDASKLTGTASAINGSNITNLAAANLSGTAAAINGSNITNLAAANLSGTASAINGSNITNLPGPSNANVLTGVVSATAGAVGGYVFAYLNAVKSPNDTISGNNSDYKYAGKNNENLPSGTYRIMGKTHSSDTDTQRLTVVLRIS